MPVDAKELFELYAARQEEQGFRREPPWFERGSAQSPGTPGEEDRVQVTGEVVRTLLGADKAARVVLGADRRGLATVVCRCTSDEVLFQVKSGDTVTVEGVCRGLEDSLTLVMELCELVGPKRPAASFLRIVPGGRAGEAGPEEPRSCDSCGKDLGEARPVVVCEACAAKHGLRPGPIGR